jgi:hypothetical protein
MASFMNHTGDDKKASSLSAGASLHDGLSGTQTPEIFGGRRRTETGTLPPKQKSGRPNAWLGDVIILLIIAALGVSMWFGYRYLKQKYAPLWERRTVTYCILVEGLDPALIPYGSDGQMALCGQAVYASDREDADNLGTVVSAETVLVTREGQGDSVDLYLYVEAETQYQAGDGYWAGDTRLLAGSQSTYRFFGLIAQGQIIFLEEKPVETASDTSADTDMDPETDTAAEADTEPATATTVAAEETDAEVDAGPGQDEAPVGAEGEE